MGTTNHRVDPLRLDSRRSPRLADIVAALATHTPRNSRSFVGRTPWSAADALVGHPDLKPRLHVCGQTAYMRHKALRILLAEDNPNAQSQRLPFSDPTHRKLKDCPAIT